MPDSLPRVVVVDDDPSFRRAIERLLRASGMDASSLGSAEEYLQWEGRESADCLVVDVHLGGISGFELQRMLELAGAATPIVFVSAHENPEYPVRARELGAVEFLAKPVPGDLLLEAVRRAIR